MLATVSVLYLSSTFFWPVARSRPTNCGAQMRRFFSLAALASAVVASALHSFLGTYGDVNRLDWGPWGQFILLALVDMGLYLLSLGSCALALPAWLSEGPTE